MAAMRISAASAYGEDPVVLEQEGHPALATNPAQFQRDDGDIEVLPEVTKTSVIALYPKKTKSRAGKWNVDKGKEANAPDDIRGSMLRYIQHPDMPSQNHTFWSLFASGS